MSSVVLARGQVSASVIDGRQRLADQFASAEPFGHVVIDDFLDAGFAERLLADFPAFERGNCISDVGRAGEKSTFERVRALGNGYAELDDLIKSPQFLSLISTITGIPQLIYDPWYLGGGTHENRHGAGLDPHIDFNFHPIERWRRRLNLIVYLNHDWQESWGGALNLYRDPKQDTAPAVTVSPVFNRCVLFETHEHSWHGFNPIVLPEAEQHVSRRSIALYFYSPPVASDSQPPDAHSTVYVGRRLPQHLHSGQTLTERDMDELQSLVHSYDIRMDTLHQEIARLMTLVQAHEHGLAGSMMYMARKAFAKLRRARQGH